MATNKTSEINKLVARCRRIGWTVEQGEGGGTQYKYRVLLPTGGRVQIHSSPSDVNWHANVLRQLDAGGFSQAEAAWAENDERVRKERIAADRKAADAKAARAAARRTRSDAAIARAAGDLGVCPVDVGWLFTPTDVPQTRTVLISPEVAQKALDTVNTANRRKREDRTEEFVEIINAGDWGCTHQGGAMDSNGVLQDGQHRFQAIVETGKTLPMQMSVGMPPENFRKVDTPMMRTIRDAAYLRGEVNISALTAATRMILHLDKWGTEAHTKRVKRLSIDVQDRAIIDMGDDLRDAVTRARRIRVELKVSCAALATAVYKITGKLPKDDPRVIEFFDQIETGIGINRSHPVWLLRRMFIRAQDLRGQRLRQFEALAYIMKAWNHVARGSNVTALVWRANEPFPAEPFLPPPLEPGGDQ